MDLIVEIVKFLIYSIVIVLVSKYILVKILRNIGELLKLKANVIGNIAGVATSIPELLTVSFSAFTGLISASLYNIISSNVINFIQYSATVVMNKNQKVLRNKAIKIDLILVAITIIIPIIMIIINLENSFAIVPIFIIVMILFYKITNNAHKLYMHKIEKKGEKEKIQDDMPKMHSQADIQKMQIEDDNKNKQVDVEHVDKQIRKSVILVIMQGVLLLLVGIVLYVVGNLLSDVLNNLCRRFEVPEFIVGIVLGFITSIPELITFFESQRHHEDDKEGVEEATSNLLTSNMMNLFVIQSLGICIYFWFYK